MGLAIHALKHPVVLGALAVGLLVEKFKEMREKAGEAIEESVGAFTKTKFEFPALEEAADYRKFIEGLEKIVAEANGIEASMSRANAQLALYARITGETRKLKLAADLAGVDLEAEKWKQTRGAQGISPEAAAERRAQLTEQSAEEERTAKKEQAAKGLEITEQAAARAQMELEDAEMLHDAEARYAEMLKKSVKMAEAPGGPMERAKEDWKKFTDSTAGNTFKFMQDGQERSMSIPSGQTGKSLRETLLSENVQYGKDLAKPFNPFGAQGMVEAIQRSRAAENNALNEAAIKAIDDLSRRAESATLQQETRKQAEKEATESVKELRGEIAKLTAQLEKLTTETTAKKGEIGAEAGAEDDQDRYRTQEATFKRQARAYQSAGKTKELEELKQDRMEQLQEQWMLGDPASRYKSEKEMGEIESGTGRAGKQFWELNARRIEQAGRDFSQTSGADALGNFSNAVVEALDRAQADVESMRAKLDDAVRRIESQGRGRDASYT